MAQTVQCEICHKTFTSYNPNPRFCSLKCKADSQKADIDVDTAIQLYESGLSQCEVAETLGTTQKVIFNVLRRANHTARKAIKRNQLGPNNSSWKGDRASYTAFHYRVAVMFGQPKKCEVCGTTDDARAYDWANLTGNYADPADYKRMCRSCHWKHDNKHLNFKGAIGGRPSPTQLATKGVDAK